MNQLYREASERLLESVSKYMEGEITLDELKEADLQEKLVYEYQTWDSLEQALRSNIFAKVRRLYDEVNQMDKCVRELDQLCAPKVHDVDIEAVKAHAHILGRNRMPPAGFYGSSWYCGAFPTSDMVDSLKENIKDEPAQNAPDWGDAAENAPYAVYGSEAGEMDAVEAAQQALLSSTLAGHSDADVAQNGDSHYHDGSFAAVAEHASGESSAESIDDIVDSSNYND
ncbi:hypothetical protein PAPHI01_1030 [Pancytospora philotis]|nr:hypothetical protein PAPHI01_1030 [Pancytospora philotis]